MVDCTVEVIQAPVELIEEDEEELDIGRAPLLETWHLNRRQHHGQLYLWHLDFGRWAQETRQPGEGWLPARGPTASSRAWGKAPAIQV